MHPVIKMNTFGLRLSILSTVRGSSIAIRVVCSRCSTTTNATATLFAQSWLSRFSTGARCERSSFLCPYLPTANPKARHNDEPFNYVSASLIFRRAAQGFLSDVYNHTNNPHTLSKHRAFCSTAQATANLGGEAASASKHDT